jgi:hypothetical protein
MEAVAAATRRPRERRLGAGHLAATAALDRPLGCGGGLLPTVSLCVALVTGLPLEIRPSASPPFRVADYVERKSASPRS